MPSQRVILGRPRDPRERFYVADDSHATSGFMLEFVQTAKKMKSFTRDSLLNRFPNVERAKLLRYFYQCSGWGVFGRMAEKEAL